MSQEAVSFSSFIGNSRKVSILISESLRTWKHLLSLWIFQPSSIFNLPEPKRVEVNFDQTSGVDSRSQHSVGESHSSRKDEGTLLITDHLVNYDDTIDAYWRFLISLFGNPILIPMRVPLFVIRNVALDDHKCNHNVFWIFYRRDQVYMRLKRANALYADSLEDLP